MVAGLLVAYGTYFSVSEGQAARGDALGEPVREISEAGPYWKWPWPIEQVHFIDARMKLFNTPYTATFTRDKRGVILLTFVAWRVEKPLLFLQAAGGPEVAEKKLDGMVTAAKNFQMGRYDLAALVSTQAGAIKASEIEQAILDDVRGPMLDKFGIRVDQVGFTRIAFAEENVPAVLANMRSERKAEADRLRAEGDKEAQAIRDDALVKSEEMLREGRVRPGKAIRGQEARKRGGRDLRRCPQTRSRVLWVLAFAGSAQKGVGRESNAYTPNRSGLFRCAHGPGPPDEGRAARVPRTPPPRNMTPGRAPGNEPQEAHCAGSDRFRPALIPVGGARLVRGLLVFQHQPGSAG